MPTVAYNDRQKIIAQAIREIQFARSYKQGKTRNWQLNEDLYYGRKLPTEETSRANVDLSRMQEYVHTLLSKIDTPMSFKYVKRKLSQLKRVDMLNALRVIDQDRDDWNIKDLVGKKQGAIYGRAIYSYFADSYDGYCPHLGNVDVYDFLIDPSAGGIDIERAKFLGDYGVVLSREEIKRGVKDGMYLKTEADQLLAGSGNAMEMTQEQTNKNNRIAAQNTTIVNREISDPDKFKFWRWGTTYKGQRYYLLMSEVGGTAIRVEPIEEVFESGLWWYWTYAVFPDLTEFWTPSYCDYVREIFMAQNVTINQAIDNTEEINKPQKAVDVGAIKNLAELKYQRGGNPIRMVAGTDINRALQFIRPPSINTPIQLFNVLESIQEKGSGITASAKGVGEEELATVYTGNEMNTADRFGLLNKSYAFGYKRFARLWEAGVREHLIKRVAIDIMGPDGVMIMEVNRRDIFRKGDDFGLIVESSSAESAMSQLEKKAKIAFLTAESENPIMSQKKAFEIKAQVAGFDDDTIRQLMDSSEFGESQVMSEAERDIELILDGENVPPNPAANTAYKQRFVDYLRLNQDTLSIEESQRLIAYVDSLEEIVVQNMIRQAREVIFKMQMKAILAGNTQPDTGGRQTNVKRESVGAQVEPDSDALPESEIAEKLTK